jgi:hypothetical protein
VIRDVVALIELCRPSGTIVQFRDDSYFAGSGFHGQRIKKASLQNVYSSERSYVVLTKPANRSLSGTHSKSIQTKYLL